MGRLLRRPLCLNRRPATQSAVRFTSGCSSSSRRLPRSKQPSPWSARQGACRSQSRHHRWPDPPLRCLHSSSRPQRCCGAHRAPCQRPPQRSPWSRRSRSCRHAACSSSCLLCLLLPPLLLCTACCSSCLLLAPLPPLLLCTARSSSCLLCLLLPPLL